MMAVPSIPERVQWTVDLLGVRGEDHLLEIGCGPGHTVTLICARLGRGTITAIDRSALQVKRARERNAECIAAGRARIEHATLEDLPPGRRRYDKIFAINVNAFWTSPPPAIASVRRLIRSGGQLYLSYEPPTAAKLRDVRGSLPQRLEEHGLRVVEIHETRFRRSFGLCVVSAVV